MQLTTTTTPDGIICEHKTYGVIATIKRNTDRAVWLVMTETPISFMSALEFQSLQAAEYAALIIAHELEASGY